ncbi:hypothetical protein C8R46DRAFT_1363034 [Mycena filopes]|nr:hypothetical protein C8R46DRAFT_1363034 [Mycena filopes]
MSARMVLQIPELCDHITTHLGSCTDLKTCALPTKTFAFAAQRQLFHDIILVSHSKTLYEPDPRSGGESSRYAEVGLCQRFCGVLKTTPHLLPFVRRLRVGYCADAVVEQLATVQFPNLKEVVFSRGRGGTLQQNTLIAMRSIIGLPTIRRVGLLSARFRDAEDFRLIFQLKPHLDFLRCYWLWAQPKSTECNAPTATIKELQIAWHVAASDTLIKSFDFSKLEKLQFDIHFLNSLDADILALSRRTLTSLKVGPRYRNYGSRPLYHRHPFSGLSALKSLHIASIVGDFADITMALTQISTTPNCLETITLTLLYLDKRDAPTRLRSLHDLASSVSTLPLQALIQLDLCLGEISGEDKDVIPREVESAFSIFPASVKVSVIP